MAVNDQDVELVLDDQLPLQPLGDYATQQQRQDREHTRIFLTDIQLRYPAGPPPANLVTAAIAAINVHPVITASIVRQQITAVENRLGLPSTEPVVPAPANPVQPFLERLAARRGAYTWVPGPTPAFTAWVHGPSPLEYPLSITARINCWEAVLVAAAESGLVSLGTVRGAYIGNREQIHDRVLDVLIRMGATQVDHADDTPGDNDMRAGDVVLIAGVTGPLHHVVAVIDPDQDDYRNVRVMSLWDAVGGGVFNQATLDELLREPTTFWYASL